MRQVAIKAALLSSIIAVGLAAAAPASAAPTLRRLRNADTTHGNFYLGIPGGPHSGHVYDNLSLVVWALSQNDQLWYVPDDNGFGQFQNYYTDSSNIPVCLGVTGTGNGVPVIDQPCDVNNAAQVWQLIGSNKVGRGTQFPGCYILWNTSTSKAIGVQSGNVTNGGAVIQWDYDGTANQFWCEN